MFTGLKLQEQNRDSIVAGLTAMYGAKAAGIGHIGYKGSTQPQERPTSKVQTETLEMAGAFE